MFSKVEWEVIAQGLETLAETYPAQAQKHNAGGISDRVRAIINAEEEPAAPPQTINEARIDKGLLPLDANGVSQEPLAETPFPQLPASIAGNMQDVIAELISDVAEAIEARIGGRRSMTGDGGPYEASLRIAYDKRLNEAAVAAIEAIVMHPKPRPR